jgi:prefoldin subunit 5
MDSNGDSLIERVQASYRQLSAFASDLNAVSDELGKSITDLDSTLKKLNLGISVWVDIRSGEDPQSLDYWSEDIGYAKIGGRWGIALRTVKGNPNWPDDDIEEWLFNEAPRLLRLSAIGKIAELLEKLSEKAAETTKKIKEKLGEAQKVAAAVKQAAELPKRVPIPRVPLKPAGEQKIGADRS